MTPDGTKWTNRSVLQFAKDDDPIKAVTRRAREMVTDAIDAGWSGPPFDPLVLADLLKLKVVPRDEVRDARTVADADQFRIEFNPNRPRWRVRYSVAHEIAHTFFPDCAERVRNRAAHDELKGDEWQLEALCNIAASEIIMPIGSLPSLAPSQLEVDELTNLRDRYDVSTEALFIRVVRSTDTPCLIVCASPVEQGAAKGHLRVDYMIASAGWKHALPRVRTLSPTSPAAQCTVIGYTAKGMENWEGIGRLRFECVGIPPYPGASLPRVVAIATTGRSEQSSTNPILYLKGNALEPRGSGNKIIAQIVNDKALNWAPLGFAQAIGKKWPMARAAFHTWAVDPRNRALGQIHLTEAERGVWIASMVAQRAYGPSSTPRIRYSALQECLERLATEAGQRHASVHMPRIGTGQARGSWDMIRELIATELGTARVPVTVYDLPTARPLRNPADTTDLASDQQTASLTPL